MNGRQIPKGAWTALVTPFSNDNDVDWIGLRRLASFQISQGITGIVPVGTTGESPTVLESEHKDVMMYLLCKFPNIFIMPGCGSNNTNEAIAYTKTAAENGAKAVLLVDPYYNKPTSLWIRQNYLEPITKEFPDVAVVPYIIPGRTAGTGLMPYDLEILVKEYPNVVAIKDATGGDLTRMAENRLATSSDFQIFCGDDNKTFETMTRQDIRACGVISVVSNIIPFAIQEICQTILRGDFELAKTMVSKVQPLLDLVTVTVPRIVFSAGRQKVVEETYPNPAPIKVMMEALKMPSGFCRKPLGKMSRTAVQKVRDALIKVWAGSPAVLNPIEDFFKVDIKGRLSDEEIWNKFCC